MRDLTPTERERLLEIADADPVGGKLVPFRKRVDADLIERELIYHASDRLRCTHEGMDLAKRMREEA